MPTFYDPIVLEDIDINDNAASFYLISLPDNGGFKFCATTQNLNNPQIKFDPVTKINQYWPITRDQLNHANLAILFPEDLSDSERKQKIRTAPFKTVTDLNQAFNFNPPFNPDTPKMTFGQPQQPRSDTHIQQDGNARQLQGRNARAEQQRQPAINAEQTQRLLESYQLYVAEYNQTHNSVQNDFFSGMNTNINFAWFNIGQAQRSVEPTRLSPQEIEQITGLTRHRDIEQYRQDVLNVRNSTQALGPVESRSPHNLPQEPADLMQQATTSGLSEPQLATIRYHTLRITPCVEALREGLFSFNDFLNMDQQMIYGVSCLILNKPAVIEAIRNHGISIQDFQNLNIDQVSNLGRVALIHQSCINAIADGRTSIEQLANMDYNSLKQAVESDHYPQQGIGLH